MTSETAICSVCHQERRVYDDSLMSWHGGFDGECEGSRKPPLETRSEDEEREAGRWPTTWEES